MSPSLAHARWEALGTTVGVAVHGEDALGAARAAVDAEVRATDLACSRFRADSELTAVNMARGHRVGVSAVLLDFVEAALRGAALTDGLVDPTVGGAVTLAGYDRDFASVRGSRARRVRAARVAGWRAVELDRAARTLRLPEGVQLDLGATAKALAADRAALRALAASPADGVLVNLGGDIATIGRAPTGGWEVHVADSHRSSGRDGQSVTLASGGLSTSSTTVRRWRRRGGHAHHIIDPATGAPAREHWRTASVAAATCLDANIASTAAIVLGAAAGDWLAARGLPARLVALEGGVETLGGWPQEIAVAA
jgi:thiamine biosynthesis lipoprotein